MSVCSATKGAVVGFTLAAAKELQPQGANVDPGPAKYFSFTECLHQ